MVGYHIIHLFVPVLNGYNYQVHYEKLSSNSARQCSSHEPPFILKPLVPSSSGKGMGEVLWQATSSIPNRDENLLIERVN